jgi:hypothetical protein
VDEVLTDEYLRWFIERGALYIWYYVYRPMGAEPHTEYCVTREQLIEIRRKQLTERRFKAGSDKSAGFIKWANTAGVPAIVGILGLFYFLWRRADSVAYERKFIQRQA